MESHFVQPLNVSALLKKYGLRPSKGLGQNFLVDENILRKIANVAEISAGDVVLEVGPGLGSLTRYLAVQARQVIAVELDGKMLPVLHETLAAFSNVKIIIGDVLKINPTELLASYTQSASSYRVVANIPYYITSALIRHLLEAEIQPSSMVLTVQKEVAQRICDQPPNMSLLALGVQVYGEPKTASKIPAGAFYPSPKVDSMVVIINLYPDPLIPNEDLPQFFLLAKSGFSQKRKTLLNALSAGMRWPKDQTEEILSQAGIDSKRRAQTLSIPEWGKLTRYAK